MDKMQGVTVLVILFASTLVDAQGNDYLCIGIPAGETFLLPYPGDCSKYYECYDGYLSLHNCPSGLWFNSAVQTCDHPDASGCNTIMCPPGIVDFFPYPGDCAQYIECYNGLPEHHSCPGGLWFNAQQKRCVYAPESECGQYSTSVQPPGTTPTTCYGVRPGLLVLKPYPGDCNKYIECYGSQEAIYSCPPYLWFDESRQMCDIPVLSDCYDGGPTPNPPDNDINDPRCANGNTWYWPDVECGRYVACYQGHGYLFDCPNGLYFDSISRICEDPSLSDCGRTPSPTPEPSTSPGWTPDPFCPWPSYDRYLFPYPGDCTKYIVCYYGERTVEPCPPNLWFNPILLVCDYPYEAGCFWAAEKEEV